MARSAKGIFTPENPDKYTGDYPIIFRSSWEKEFMEYCDHHPDVLSWASEPHKIPYENPLNGKQTVYVPDFLVTYVQRGGGTSTKLIEIKPLHETTEAHARNSKDVATRMRNEAKWGAARQWAMRRGIDFLILTEAELFKNHANRKGRMHPVRAIAKEQVKAPNPTGPKKAKKQAPSSLASSSRKIRSRSKARISSVMSRKTKKVGKARKR